MANFDPRPDERRNTTFTTRGDETPSTVRGPASSRSTGATIAGILLVIGLILLGLMFLTPARTPPVNPNPTGTTVPPAPVTPPVTPAPATPR